MVYESASEFENHMDRGDIVDYSPYLQNPSKYKDHLHSMAVNGVCVDELVALHDEDLQREIIMNFLGVKAIGFLKELIIKRLKVEYKENFRTVQRGILSKSIR